MPINLRYVGLDVHAETIAVAVAEADGEVRSLGILPNRLEAVAKLIRKLGPREHLRVCYEAGPCGYVLYWQLTRLGVHGEVVAPTLVPMKPGDRVKTDRRDAEKLARCYRAGDLTAVWVPDAAHEALRDLVRAREAAKQDQLRARHRLGKFLLRQGRRPPEGVKPWTQRHRRWLDALHFELPAQQATLADYLSEVDHAAARVARLESALDEAVAAAPAPMRAVIAALQTLRGIRQGIAGPLHAPPRADGLQRDRAERTLERRPRASRGDHENRQRSSAARARRSRLGLPLPSQVCEGAPATPTRAAGGDHRHRLESAAAAVSSLSPPPGAGETHAARDHRHRPRARRFHLGDRHRGGTGAGHGGVTPLGNRRSRGTVTENPRPP